MAGEGQKTQTKSRSIETGVNNQIRQAVRRYRIAYHAISQLDPAGDWTNEFQELREEDNRGPLKEAEETGTGDGRYHPSWIWRSPSAKEFPGEGSLAERQEVNETAHHEWMTCRARADRWVEEEELLQEEMRRVILYLEWKSRDWSEKVAVRTGSCTPNIQHGIDSYARKQVNIYHKIARSFACRWLPYLNACGLNTKWATEFLWASWITSDKTKLPKRFSVTSADPPRALPTADLSSGTGGQEMRRKLPDTCKTQSEGGNHRGVLCTKRSNDNNGEGGLDGNEERNSDDENEGYGDNNEEEGFNDEAENNEDLDFEYDDEYMA